MANCTLAPSGAPPAHDHPPLVAQSAKQRAPPPPERSAAYRTATPAAARCAFASATR
jgi:hypothetical protein